MKQKNLFNFYNKTPTPSKKIKKIDLIYNNNDNNINNKSLNKRLSSYVLVHSSNTNSFPIIDKKQKITSILDDDTSDSDISNNNNLSEIEPTPPTINSIKSLKKRQKKNENKNENDKEDSDLDDNEPLIQETQISSSLLKNSKIQSNHLIDKGNNIKKTAKKLIYSDTEEEYSPNNISSEEDYEEESLDDMSQDDDMENIKKNSRNKKYNKHIDKNKNNITKSKNEILKNTNSNTTNSSNSNTNISMENNKLSDKVVFIHHTLPWLNEKRIDLKGRDKNHKDFNPKTIEIPLSYLKKETPAMKQWWEFKKENFDTLLFFKVGKFYELFHMDAEIAVKELDLIYMRNSMNNNKAHCGFPEISYGKYSNILINKGYKVARIEQTETPEMMKIRNSKSSNKTKVVRREICSLISSGTNTQSHLDGNEKNTDPKMLLSIRQEKCNKDGKIEKINKYGVVLVNCATGEFYLGMINDETNGQLDSLRTFLSVFNIVEVIYSSENLHCDTKTVLSKHRSTNNGILTHTKLLEEECWRYDKVIDEIEKNKYFSHNNNNELNNWPQTLVKYKNNTLTMEAFGCLMVVLNKSLIDFELISMRNFKEYIPCSNESGVIPTIENCNNNDFMVLDAHSLRNLEILQNNYDFKKRGSLFDIVDKTVTSFGRRKMQEWLLKPLSNIDAINERLDIVQDLLLKPELVGKIRKTLRSLPDLEKLLFRIHSQGSITKAKDHPESRAIMYENKTYNLRKINSFLSLLKALEDSNKLFLFLKKENIENNLFQSRILKSMFQITNEMDKNIDSTNIHSGFPDLTNILHHFNSAFDHKVALQEGIIVPERGTDEEYDEANDSIDNLLNDLNNYLEEEKRKLKTDKIIFWGSKLEDRFQLEISDSIYIKIPKEYEIKSKKKGYKRYHTPYIKNKIKELMQYENKKELALKDQMRKIFYKFDEKKNLWKKALHSLALLDCYLSLTLVSNNYTRPIFLNQSDPFIEIIDGIHPSIAQRDDIEFIPNDTILGDNSINKGLLLLLSGPNMGGKSTLLRQTCIIVIMAQIGCYVPAKKCLLTPVDRIFTRLGASDNILANQSTFFVELSETATILNYASKHSLVILDELGRGTSTFDGTAIASAVVDYLLNKIKCRTMFATHYHSLIEEYHLMNHINIQLGHMSCMLDPINDKKIVFLYKLQEGMCPKSYGLNVARLANIPDQVIKRAEEKSIEFEKLLIYNTNNTTRITNVHNKINENIIINTLQNNIKMDNINEIRKIWKEINNL